MRRLGFVVLLALCGASLVSPARSLPVQGRLEVALQRSPGVAPRNTTITFTASASDPDGAVRSAQICFGDGTPCQTDAMSQTTVDLVLACGFGDNWGPRRWDHKYTAAGSYQATLTVVTRGCPGIPEETRQITVGVSVT